MRGERRRWRPTPREPTLSLGELLGASAHAVDAGARVVGRRQQSRRASKEKKQQQQQQQQQSERSVRNEDGGSASGALQHSTTVVVENMVVREDLEDPDERADLEEELRAVFGRHGALQSVVVGEATGAITVAYKDGEGAQAAVGALHGTLYGSRAISVRLLPVGTGSLASSRRQVAQPAAGQAQALATEREAPRKKSKRRSKLKINITRDRAQQEGEQEEEKTTVASSLQPNTLVIRNMLDPLELEDEDEFDDVYREVHGDLSKYGELERFMIARDDAGDAANTGVGSIQVSYKQPHAAAEAFKALNDKLFGGRLVTCAWLDGGITVRVEGMLDPEELEDSDEYEDVQAEVRAFFAGDDHLRSVEIIRESGHCIVKCDSDATASEFIHSVTGKKYGGRLLTAQLQVAPVKRPAVQKEVQAEALVPTSGSTESTGDAPSAQPQHVPTQAPAASPKVAELAVVLLKRLAALQERAHVQNPLQDKRSRRLVLGLHEVRRGISQGKVKLLVVGTDLKDARPIRDAVEELVAAAREQDIPVIWPVTRRKLGRVLKKSVRVSCVGVYSVDGAIEVFRQLLGSI